MKRLLLSICFLFILSEVSSQTANFEWASPLAGPGNEQGSAIVVEPVSANVYCIGTFQSVVDFDPGAGIYNLSSAGDYDISITKLSPSGDLIWAKSIGSTGTDYGYDIDVDHGGNIYVTGRFTGTVDFDPNGGTTNLTSYGDGDIFICKYSSAGNLVYAKQFGGPYLDEGHSLVVDANSNVYATGDFDIVADFDPTGGTYTLNGLSCTNLYVVKLGTDGNMLWAKNTSGPGQGFSIALDNSGYVVTTGPFYGTMDFDPTAATDNLTSFGEFDIFLWKLDAVGNHVWVKQMGSDNAGGGFDCGNGVAIDGSGNIYSTGFFIGTADFDPGPATFNLTAGNYDAYISKLDQDGNFVWTKNITGFNAERGFAIDVDSDGSVYTTGDFIGTADFDPGAGTHNISSTWSANMMFIHKLDSAGNFVWAQEIGGNGIGYDVQLDFEKSIYITGIYYYGTADFDMGPGTDSITAVGANDGLVYKMSQGFIGINEVMDETEVLTFPNPTVQIINIESEFEITDIKLTNSSGEFLQPVMNLNLNQAKVDLSNLPKGVYILQIKTTKGAATRKIVKE